MQEEPAPAAAPSFEAGLDMHTEVPVKEASRKQNILINQ